MNIQAAEPSRLVVSPRVVTLAIDGEIGEIEIAEVLEMLGRSGARGAVRVVVDLSDCVWLDPRAVPQLLVRAAQFRRDGGDIKVCGLSPRLRAIFRSAGFEAYARAEDARAAF